MKNKDDQKKKGRVLKVCHGRHCGGVGKFILERLEAEMDRNPHRGAGRSAKKTVIESCPCRGMCAEGPIVVEEKDGKTTFHKKMDPIKAAKIL